MPPVADGMAERLILGSMPGRQSLAAGQYYAHPRNVFWRIMGELVGAHPHLPYAARLQVLQSARLALWDVLHSCERKGSLDSDIQAETANDFARFFAEHPHITHVGFNGAKAEQSFRRLVLGKHPLPPLVLTRLPSTSPAHAGMPYAEKLACWRAFIAPRT
ncbi:MAG: DNA-deoxyinosine glycosylase [Sideroxydans sp.]